MFNSLIVGTITGRLVMRVFLKSAIHFGSMLNYSGKPRREGRSARFLDENEWQTERKQPFFLLPRGE